MPNMDGLELAPRPQPTPAIFLPPPSPSTLLSIDPHIASAQPPGDAAAVATSHARPPSTSRPSRLLPASALAAPPRPVHVRWPCATWTNLSETRVARLSPHVAPASPWSLLQLNHLGPLSAHCYTFSAVPATRRDPLHHASCSISHTHEPRDA